VKLVIASSGGVGGLRLQGQIDTDELEPALAEGARRLVDLAASEAAPDPGAAQPDGLEYDLTWFVEAQPGREVAHRRRFTETSAPPFALETLQSLMREVVRRRAASRSRRARD